MRDDDDPNDEAPLQVEQVQLQQLEGDVIIGDMVGGDKVIGDKVGGDKVIGDKRVINTEGGEYAEGNIDKRQGIFLEPKLKDITMSLVKLLPNYLGILLGILVSPKRTFTSLVGSSKDNQYSISLSEWDERPILFAGLSLIIGVVLAKSLSISGAPANFSIYTLGGIFTTYILLWSVYGVGIHAAAKIFGGKGTFQQTVIGTLYVLGALHVFLILSIYFTSTLLNNALQYAPAQTVIEYRETLLEPERDSVHYPVTRVEPFERVISSEQIKWFGVKLQTWYYLLSSLLAAFYLYFPIKEIHKLSSAKTAALFIVGLVLIISIFVVGILAVFAVGLAILSWGTSNWNCFIPLSFILIFGGGGIIVRKILLKKK